MKNPIIDNRIVCNYTFAVRLFRFLEKVDVQDFMSLEERDMFMNVAQSLLKYQCKTAVDPHEIDYLKDVGNYDENTKPWLVTEDGFSMYDEEPISLYSCMREPSTSGQILTIKLTPESKINPYRVYFVHEEECIKYIEYNKPSFSKKQLDEIISNLKK